MKKTIKKYGILALGILLSACALQGCYIDGEGCHTRTSCYTECNHLECYDVCTEYEYCTDSHYYGGSQCRYDWDCASWASCIDGFCVERNSNYYSDFGYVQACGFWTDTGQCAGKGSACTLLKSGEQVCTIPCSDTFNSSDCPVGYTCMTYGEFGNAVTQCLPINNSCDPNYCENDFQCGNNGSCVFNRCVAPYNTGDNCQYGDCTRIAGPEYPYCYTSKTSYSYCTSGCYHDVDCGGMYSGYACALTSNVNTMDSGVCVVSDDAYCEFSSDCPTALTCVGGRCTISCRSDRDCMNSAGYQDFYCAGGYCRMASYQQYVNW